MDLISAPRDQILYKFKAIEIGLLGQSDPATLGKAELEARHDAIPPRCQPVCGLRALARVCAWRSAQGHRPKECR